MIPQFPNFKNIELSDKEGVENITKQYPPYSDFNFTSMWSWDTEEKISLSELDGNLILKFIDYLDNKPFYSFIGNQNTRNIINLLLDLSKKEKLTPLLKLVPDYSVKNLKPNEFEIIEDRDNFDYIYEMSALYENKGGKFQRKRNIIKNFLKANPYVETRNINMAKSSISGKGVFAKKDFKKF